MKLFKLSLCALAAVPTLALAAFPASYWVKSSSGQALPQFAVQGGHEQNGAPLYICQAKHHGGMHPGKIVNGNCNITWGGAEIVKSNFKVLVSQAPQALAWVKAGNGYVPPGAVAGGYENGHPLFVCKTKYMNAVYTGKIVGTNCNFGYAGQEMWSPVYKALVD